MNKRLAFIFVLAVGLNVFGRAADAPVPATPAAALGLPSSVSSQDSTRADEIRNLWRSGKKSKAEKLIAKWSQEPKRPAKPWVVAASLQFEDKRYKKCLSLAEKALKISPQEAEAYYWRGRAYEAMKNLLDAANEYRAAVLAAPDYADAKDALQRVQSQLGTPSMDARNHPEQPTQ